MRRHRRTLSKSLRLESVEIKEPVFGSSSSNQSLYTWSSLSHVFESRRSQKSQVILIPREIPDVWLSVPSGRFSWGNTKRDCSWLFLSSFRQSQNLKFNWPEELTTVTYSVPSFEDRNGEDSRTLFVIYTLTTLGSYGNCSQIHRLIIMINLDYSKNSGKIQIIMISIMVVR